MIRLMLTGIAVIISIPSYKRSVMRTITKVHLVTPFDLIKDVILKAKNLTFKVKAKAKDLTFNTKIEDFQLVIKSS